MESCESINAITRVDTQKRNKSLTLSIQYTIKPKRWTTEDKNQNQNKEYSKQLEEKQ